MYTHKFEECKFLNFIAIELQKYVRTLSQQRSYFTINQTPQTENKCIFEKFNRSKIMKTCSLAVTLGPLVVSRVGREVCLEKGKEEESACSHYRENCPWTAEIVVHQARAPLMPPSFPVLINFLIQMKKIMV